MLFQSCWPIPKAHRPNGEHVRRGRSWPSRHGLVVGDGAGPRLKSENSEETHRHSRQADSDAVLPPCVTMHLPRQIHRNPAAYSSPPGLHARRQGSLTALSFAFAFAFARAIDLIRQTKQSTQRQLFSAFDEVVSFFRNGIHGSCDGSNPPVTDGWTYEHAQLCPDVKL